MSAEQVTYLRGRIGAIHQELDERTEELLHKASHGNPKTSIKGLWRGVKISEAGIARAQRELFKHAHESKRKIRLPSRA